MMRLENAAKGDLSLVRTLVLAAGLPPDGLEEQFPEAYVLARSETEVIGLAGLERYGECGLLRSVVVAERHRNAGLGRLLVLERLNAARERGLERVFLLTTTAAAYFEKLGFVAVPRAEVPAAVAASVEFAGVCPASAACLCFDVRSAPIEPSCQ